MLTIITNLSRNLFVVQQLTAPATRHSSRVFIIKYCLEENEMLTVSGERDDRCWLTIYSAKLESRSLHNVFLVQ